MALRDPRPHLLDTTGLFCPVPVLLTARAMASLAEGERLEMIGDDPEILRDIPVWCEQTGNRLLEMTRVGRKIRCRLEKASLLPIGAP